MNRVNGVLLAVLVVGLASLVGVMGCNNSDDPIENQEAMLVDIESDMTKCDNQYDMYRTTRSDSLLCILNSTEVVGGTLSNLCPGLLVTYDATTHAWVQDNLGLNYFVWLADKVTIYQSLGENQPAPGPVNINSSYSEDANHVLLDDGNYIPLGPQ